MVYMCSKSCDIVYGTSVVLRAVRLVISTTRPDVSTMLLLWWQHACANCYATAVVCVDNVLDHTLLDKL
jgi:hypothetical protein